MVERGAVAGAGLRSSTPEANNRAYQAFDPTEWAWEYLRRNAGYQADWRAGTPRSFRCVQLRDGTALLRLRRRYPRAERWGLYVFANPFRGAKSSGILAARHIIALAAFRPDRLAVIGVDGVPTISLKGRGFDLALVALGSHVLTRPAAVTFELGFDELRPQIECLRILQRLIQSNAPVSARQVPANLSERLFQTLVALDGSLFGLSYREIAVTVFGQKRVAEDWAASSRFLKDRTRRLVAKGHELMNGGYRDLLR